MDGDERMDGTGEKQNSQLEDKTLESQGENKQKEIDRQEHVGL